MNTGRIASAAVLRNSSSTGMWNSRTGRYHAIAAPSGIAIAMASVNPIPERTRLALRWRSSSPLLAIDHHSSSTTCSGGRK